MNCVTNFFRHGLYRLKVVHGCGKPLDFKSQFFSDHTSSSLEGVVELSSNIVIEWPYASAAHVDATEIPFNVHIIAHWLLHRVSVTAQLSCVIIVPARLWAVCDRKEIEAEWSKALSKPEGFGRAHTPRASVSFHSISVSAYAPVNNSHGQLTRLYADNRQHGVHNFIIVELKCSPR